MSILRLPIALQQAVMQRLRADIRQANHKLNTHYTEPKVNYRQKGTIAGSAHLTSWEIYLNGTLLVENGQTFIDQVLPHELAHLLTYRQFGRVAPHGKEWQYMMIDILGVPAKRTHHFATDSVQGKTWIYRCGCQQHALTIRRHNRIVRGQSIYHCKNCGQALTLANTPQSPL